MITDEYRLGDIRHNYADISRLISFFNIEIDTNFSDQLQALCTWIRQQPLYDDKLDFANSQLKSKKLMGL